MRDGNRIPQWQIDAARQMYADGDTINYIAQQFNLSRNCIKRHVAGIERPHKRHLKTSERQKLLQRWAR
jgi:DNA-binding NarL/FixJ family response regulator